MKPRTDTTSRALHDLGIAAWFGGSLMAAVGLNGALRQVHDLRQQVRLAHAVWAQWAPVQIAAGASYFAAGTMLTIANKSRLVAERGVLTSAAIVGGAGVATALASVYGGTLQGRLARWADEPPEGGGDGGLPPEVRRDLRRLRVVQWLVPALSGTMLVFNAHLGELQRPKMVVSGIARRVLRRTS